MEIIEKEENLFELSQRKTKIQKVISSILQLRGKSRMEAILSSDNPRLLFQSIPEEEAYFTIKEIGEQDALPLLSLMSPVQCQYLLDLELWKGYEFQPERVDYWLPLLLSCDEEAINQWFHSIDIDTLILLLKNNIRVHLKNGDGYPSIDENFFTCDGTYYIEIIRPILHDAIEQLLRRLAQFDLHLYWKILHQVQWEIEAEVEERTLHFREARLEDKGFPPMEEALSLYQYLNPKRLKIMLEKKEIYLPEIHEQPLPPMFPMVLKEQTLFFSLCLRELEENPVIDRLKMELSYMANQVMVADQPESIDFSTIQRSLKKVGGYLSIGLELLSEGNVQKARECIEKIPLKFVFQIGYGATLELKWRVEKLWRSSWFSEKGVPLSFLGSPWEEKVKGLLKKRPLFYDGNVEMGYREFKSLEEIQSLKRDLDKIEILEKIFSSLSSFSYSDGLSWKNALLTSYVHDQFKCFLHEIPNSPDEIVSWLNKIQQKKTDIKESFIDWFLKIIGSDNQAEIKLIKEITTLLLEKTEE